MTEQTCARRHCFNPVKASMLCREDTATLLADLTEIGESLFPDLELQFRRGARYSTARAGSSGEAPVSFNEKARGEIVNLTVVVLTWQEHLAEHLRDDTRPYSPVAAAVWMWTTIRDRGIAAWDQAGAMADAIASAVSAAHRAIDRPADRWYAGRCSAEYPTADDVMVECPQELYANTESGTVRCPRCRTTHVVSDRRRILLDAAEDMLLTAAEAARAVVVWTDYERGENKLVQRISKWRERGRIEQRGVVAEAGGQRPLYRLRDILNLLGEETRSESATA